MFTNLLLADEINRATPRTQSALLESMAEGQVTVDGETRVLSDPFFVIATENPVETYGCFPLPEAHLPDIPLQESRLPASGSVSFSKPFLSSRFHTAMLFLLKSRQQDIVLYHTPSGGNKFRRLFI